METSCEPAGADVGALQRWARQGDDGDTKEKIVIWADEMIIYYIIMMVIRGR